MKNPLLRRYPRQLRAELGKYLAIFLLMAGTIGFLSGYLVADRSMITTYENSFEDYAIEDGHFRTQQMLSDDQRGRIEALGVDLYDLFYADLEADNGSAVRLYPWRDAVNRICVMQGEAPAGPGEIAVDRMWADNNGLAVGDSLALEGETLTITALVALSDYSALFESNGDMMFDAVRFTVAAMSPEAFEALAGDAKKPNYAWLYQGERPADEKAEKAAAEDLAVEINRIAPLEDLVPRFANQAIQFTGNDLGQDRSMMLVLLYVLIAVMAFVFALTARNTIQREASVIGTLRASGSTRGELVRHYILLPILVTLVAALVGNVLGYTVFKYVCVDMYYGSYSLPTYVTVWSSEAFLLTTLAPIALMLAINWLVLSWTLRLSPIRFLRHDLRRGRRRKALRISERLPFLRRFRLRIILQNRGSFVTLLIGILFANVLLYFGLMLPVVLRNFQADIVGSLPSKYQYVLTVPDVELNAMMQRILEANLKTDAEGAEPYCLTTLQTLEQTGYKQESVAVYGVDGDSAYIPLDFTGDAVYVSDAMADKYALKPGDSLTLRERYDDASYTFAVAGTYRYPAMMSVFMSRQRFNEMFDRRESYYNGYFSNVELDDVEPRLVAAVIDEEDMTKVSRQLDVSMGKMMYMVDAFSVVLFIILMYLLTKLIIEKNARSISMVKILGGTPREIAGLYLTSTAVATAICVLLSIPVAHLIIRELMRSIMLSKMNGWLPLEPDFGVWLEMAGLGMLAFAVVAALEYRKILCIPMDAALKNVE